jgi:hypothetical protein
VQLLKYRSYLYRGTFAEVSQLVPESDALVADLYGLLYVIYGGDRGHPRSIEPARYGYLPASGFLLSGPGDPNHDAARQAEDGVLAKADRFSLIAWQACFGAGTP